MQERIKGTALAAALAAAVLLIISGCTVLGIGSGTVNLSLTDAPVDADNVEGVYITITGLEYNKSAPEGESGWTEFTEFVPMERPVNLLDFTGGETSPLGNFELTAGQYNQIRLTLDLTADDDPGSYIEFTDGSKEPLTLPSVKQSEFKLVNAFTIPYNGDVNLVIDFDVRKGVVHNANGYKLKPAIRLIVEGEAGQINVTLENTSAYTDLVVFAYEDGSYTDAEAEDPDVVQEESRFPEAVTSAVANDEGKYVLPFLAAGTYDLVVAGYNGDVFGEVLAASGTEDVVVDDTGAETVTVTLE